MFHFLLRKVFETYQVYYTILHNLTYLSLLNSFLLTFKHISCIPKKPQEHFLIWLAYKSLLAEF